MGRRARAARGGSGTIFKLAPDGTESILHSFLGPTNGDGSFPNGVILVHGTLYGTTQNIARDDLGTVFKYTLRSGRYRKIYTFRSHDGYLPLGKLAQGPDGALYGTTSTNGQSPHAGTIFRLEEK